MDAATVGRLRTWSVFASLRTHRGKRALFIGSVVIPLVAFYAVFHIYPLVFAVVLSFFNWQASRKTMDFVGTTNFRALVDDIYYIEALTNTLRFAAMVVPSVVILSLLIALGFDRIGRRLRDIYSMLYFLPLVSSLIALSIIWRWLYHPTFGLINYFLGLVGLPQPAWLQNYDTALPAIAIMTVWRAIGFYALIFLTGLQGIPESFYEAASIDGAGSWTKFRGITVPLLTPTLLFVLVMSMIGSLLTFTQVWIMTKGGPARATIVVALYVYDQGIQRMNLGYASAIAVTLFLVILTFTYLQIRFIRTDWQY
ncbi:MAG: sugar ABC transporter permease [Chloroflexi bacterium]|nr:sugar ABC transporter permease [Chloroflexota bacterium]